MGMGMRHRNSPFKNEFSDGCRQSVLIGSSCVFVQNSAKFPPYNESDQLFECPNGNSADFFAWYNCALKG